MFLIRSRVLMTATALVFGCGRSLGIGPPRNRPTRQSRGQGFHVLPDNFNGKSRIHGDLD